MKFDLNVSYKQQQKLVMTQQMKMAINILQMASYDLREYIDKEYEENPIIECQYKEENIHYEEGENSLKEKSSEEQYGQSKKEIRNENIVSIKEQTLKEFLYEQMREINLTTEMQKVIAYMIECLDERGYLKENVRYIAKVLSIKVETVQSSLEVLQGFEPIGIAAKDIKQCLKLQVKALKCISAKEQKNLYKIIDNCLIEIAEGKVEELASKTKIKVKDVEKYIDIIKKLEPKPAGGFYIGDEIKYIIPDAEIKKENGQYTVVMNDGILPKISINKELAESMAIRDKRLASYIKENTLKASMLIKSIEERKKTILRILEKILIKQEEFFASGENHLKPMTIKEISEELHLHESTVSRAIKDKYIRTSYGTFRIKDLFQTVKFTEQSKETTVGQEYIKRLIKEMIEKEDKTSPVSDQEISDRLLKNTLNISRRTVAKYREQMGISSSNKRKKKLQNKKNI